MPSKKNYNRPAQITDAVRREELMKRERDIRERPTDDNISASEKEKMRRMIEADLSDAARRGKYVGPKESMQDTENAYRETLEDIGNLRAAEDQESYRDEAYAKGGMVKKKKYAMGGSVRGGGIAIKGVGKGKVC